MKKVLILSTSLRKNSNSDALAKEFARGAASAGHRVEEISLAGKSLHFCTGCMACLNTHTCSIKDDGVEITKKMADADVLVFATPIYYYEMSGQMKTLLDRMNPLFGTDYRFREVYLLATAAETAKSAMDGAVSGLGGWIACFPGVQLKGVVRGTGANEPGAIAKNPALEEALALGKNL